MENNQIKFNNFSVLLTAGSVEKYIEIFNVFFFILKKILTFLYVFSYINEHQDKA